MILGIDTATSTGALGLYEPGNGVVAQLSFTIERGHGRFMNPALASLFQTCALSPAQLTGIAVGLGPGSFTGVRVAVTMARTLKGVLKIPLWGLSSLAVLAMGGAHHQGLCLSLMDARNERVYYGLYRAGTGGEMEACREEGVLPLEELAQALKAEEEPILLLGDVPRTYWDMLLASLPGAIMAREPLHRMQGSLLAYGGYLAGLKEPQGQKAQDIVPRYFKGPVGRE